MSTQTNRITLAFLTNYIALFLLILTIILPIYVKNQKITLTNLNLYNHPKLEKVYHSNILSKVIFPYPFIKNTSTIIPDQAEIVLQFLQLNNVKLHLTITGPLAHLPLAIDRANVLASYLSQHSGEAYIPLEVSVSNKIELKGEIY